MSPSQLTLRDWDEENSLFPRWELTLSGRSNPAQSILHLKWNTRDDGKWGERCAMRRTVSLEFTHAEIETLILDAGSLRELYPHECLGDTQVHTHGGYSPTRSNQSSVICRSISFVLEDRYDNGFYIRKDSPVWTESDWGIKIMTHVRPYLKEAPWKNANHKRMLP